MTFPKCSIKTVLRHVVALTTVFTCLAAQRAIVLAQPPVAESAVQLAVGDIAPRFEGLDNAGNPWRLDDRLGQGNIVLCFYPGNYGIGCAKQAQLFRDRLNGLAERGVCVVAVSGDMPAAHAIFKEMHDLRFTLLADEHGALASRYGVAVAAGCKVRVTDAAGRSVLDANRRFLILNRPATLAATTFIIGADGNVLYRSPRNAPFDRDAWDVFLAARD